MQLSHAGGEEGDPDALLQTEARQLLPDNRLYRQAISTNHDPIMTAALDHLERVLLEVANSPDKLNSADIARIEHEMNTDSLLFQIRVLRVKDLQQEPKVEFTKRSIDLNENESMDLYRGVVRSAHAFCLPGCKVRSSGDLR